MTEPLILAATTPRHALPLLFTGQSQKEASVNGAHVLADLLLHPSVEGEATAPAAAPAEGECWIVAAPAQGAFAGHEGALAGFFGGAWSFSEPRDGMRVLDRATGQFLLYLSEWRREPAPLEPDGGTTVDSEARTAIVAILHLLRRTAILAEA